MPGSAPLQSSKLQHFLNFLDPAIYKSAPQSWSLKPHTTKKSNDFAIILTLRLPSKAELSLSLPSVARDIAYLAMALEAIRLEHIPATHRVYAALFQDVSNAEFLHSQLLSRNSDFEYAFIDASSVISRSQVLAAAYKGVSILLDGALKTPNVHSEIVCALSPSKNVRCPSPPPSGPSLRCICIY